MLRKAEPGDGLDLLHNGACACGGSCPRCAASAAFQPELEVSHPNDPLEQEAVRIAEQVLSGETVAAPARAEPSPKLVLQRACDFDGNSEVRCARDEGEALELRRKATASEVPRPPAGLQEVLAGPSQPVPARLRAELEPRFDRDFSGVRLHTDARAARSATSVRALAYTIGRDVVFASGRYEPDTPSGRRLIAHELAHVAQQSESPKKLQRQEDAGSLPGGAPVPPQSSSQGESTLTEEKTTAILSEVRPAVRQSVERIVISCADMRIGIQTPTINYIYKLQECSLPLGSFETSVTVTTTDFELDFGPSVAGEEEFRFRYYVEPGQQNPATLLRSQSKVPVDVVSHLPSPTERPNPQIPECLLRLDDKELVKQDSFSRNLFEPKSFEKNIWSHTIPLANFGWVDLTAIASGSLSGNISARYGPGILRQICLTRLVSRESGSAPIEHPLLGRGSRADVTNYGIGGRAHFSLPAKATVRIVGRGKLRISGDYLSVIDLAAAEGELTAQGEATLAGSVDGSVEVLARASTSRARLESRIVPVSLSIETGRIEGVDLAAEIGLHGRAGLKFRVDLSAGFELAGLNLWRQTWNIAQFDAGVSWAGGLKYSPNPGIHWDLGVLEAKKVDKGAVEELPETTNENVAEVKAEEIVLAILNEHNAQVSAPDGLSEDNALPFDWYKPLELYVPKVDLPNADDPNEVNRDDGPTTVRYQSGGRTLYVDIGVADWPAVGRSFQFIPYDSRLAPEKERFKRLLRRLGHNLSGTDVDHVWDLYLRGLEYDRFDNLWPASNQEQQLAGARHRNQIRNYQARFKNLAGRWISIVRTRHPA